MDEHDPLNLDGDAMRYEDVRVPGLRRTIEALKKTLEAPRYKRFFDEEFKGSKEKVEQWIKWSKEHIRREGQTEIDEEQGVECEFSVDAAALFMKAAEEEVQYVTDRVDDWASDPLP